MEKYKDPEGKLPVALDCAIRDSEGKQGGYIMEGKNVCYCNYMSSEDWQKYCKNISPNHREQFDDGAGGELKEGKYPPKMASFGSSSRLIYELSKNIPGFSFEEKLDTRVGGIAHLDGCMKNDLEYIYVEAKRREIYGNSHKNEKIKSVYIDVYEWIKDKCPDVFGYSKDDSEIDMAEKGIYTNVTFIINNKEVLYFDLKQLICHFLGITYDIAKHPIQNAKVKFIYLLYNPGDIKDQLDKKYKKYETKIIDRYNEVVNFVNNNIAVFKKIFNAVLEYQIEKQKLNGETKIEFEMKLVDQKNYQKEF